MLELGDGAVAYHQEVGRHLADCGVERLLSVGSLARHFGDVSAFKRSTSLTLIADSA